MRITWKDGMTTLAALGAVLLQQAHSREWDWPLISSTRWTLTGIGILAVVGFIFGYLMDSERTPGESLAMSLLMVAMITIVGLGLAYASSGYVVAALFGLLAVWVVSEVVHMFTTKSTYQQHHRV